MKKPIFFILFILLGSSLVFAGLIPTTAPCWVKGTVTGDGITVEGLTVSAYEGSTLLKSATISGGEYSLNSIGANTDDSITLKVYGATFDTLTFVGYCKTGDDPWIVENFTVSKQANGVSCSNGAICTSGTCSGGECATASDDDEDEENGGSGGPSTSSNYLWIDTSDINNFEALQVGDKVTFSFFDSAGEKTESHTVKILEISGNKVYVKITSAPQYFWLTVGEELQVDVNGDNIKDIIVKAISIVGNQVNLEIKPISMAEEKPVEEPVDVVEPIKEIIAEPTKETQPEVTAQKEPAKKTTSVPWLIIIAIVALIAAFVLFIYRPKKRAIARDESIEKIEQELTKLKEQHKEQTSPKKGKH